MTKKMICPATGVQLFVADEQVDRMKKNGYKLVGAKKSAEKPAEKPE